MTKIKDYIKSTCTSSDYGEIAQSFKKNGIKLYEELCSRGTHCLYTEDEKWLSLQCGKKWKTWSNNYIQPHAHPHTMKKTHAKFHNNRYKTVRGGALTRGTNCLYIKGEKIHDVEKVTKNDLTIISKPHAHAHPHTNTCKVSKQSVQKKKKKKWQKLKQWLYQKHMHIFRLRRKRAKFQKD